MGDRRSAKRAPGSGTGRSDQRRASRTAESRPVVQPAEVKRAGVRASAESAAVAPKAAQRVTARTSRPAPRGTQRTKRSPDEGTTKRIMRIRELDPQMTCGRGTTVMQLYRVDDLPTDTATTHLVFYDRHGWYCEHGRECPAVAAVRKHEKHNILTR